MALYYADSSALVKLVLDERQSAALRQFLSGGGELMVSELALSEVPRAVRRACARDHDLDLDVLLERSGRILEAVGLHPVDRDVLIDAGALPEPALRALDAVHVATAIRSTPPGGFITYDERQAAAARLAGLRTFAPGD